MKNPMMQTICKLGLALVGLLQFVVQADLGYTVQFRTNLESAIWNGITGISTQSLVRTVRVNAPNPPPEKERYYRIVTPPVP